MTGTTRWAALLARGADAEAVLSVCALTEIRKATCWITLLYTAQASLTWLDPMVVRRASLKSVANMINTVPNDATGTI